MAETPAKPDPVEEHKASAFHREAVLAAEQVGCFTCVKIYSPSEIDDWVDSDESGVGQTAMCARCGIDSVIPMRPGLDQAFLSRMRREWC